LTRTVFLLGCTWKQKLENPFSVQTQQGVFVSLMHKETGSRLISPIERTVKWSTSIY